MGGVVVHTHRAAHHDQRFDIFATRERLVGVQARRDQLVPAPVTPARDVAG
jgi:hypothetical protein